MKNIFSILALLFSIFVNAQNYFNFNLLTIYQVENKINNKNKYSEIILTDENSNSLRVFRNRSNKLVAVIGSKDKMSHYFKLKNDNEDILQSENFIYDFSYDFKGSSCPIRNDDFEVIALNDSVSKFNTKVICYSDRKKNIIASVLLLNKMESDFKFYENFKVGYLHHFDCCNKLNLNSNFLVESAEFQDNTNKTFQIINLVKSEVVNIKITIPKINVKDKFESYYFH